MTRARRLARLAAMQASLARLLEARLAEAAARCGRLEAAERDMARALDGFAVEAAEVRSSALHRLAAAQGGTARARAEEDGLRQRLLAARGREKLLAARARDLAAAADRRAAEAAMLETALAMHAKARGKQDGL